MSESKHQWTPGPWDIQGPTEFVNQIGIGPAIGSVYGAGPELAANAKLIAAAPELVEALEEAAEFLTLRSCPSALMDKINRALAKAGA